MTDSRPITPTAPPAVNHGPRTQAELAAQVRLLGGFLFDLKPTGVRRALAFLTSPTLVERLEATPIDAERIELVEAIRHMTSTSALVRRR